MKKMLKAISGLAIACLLVVGVCATVFAADSPQLPADIKSDNPALVAIPNGATQLLSESEARMLNNLQGGSVAVLNWDMYTTDKSPATVTFAPKGGSNAQTLIVMHYHNGVWVNEGQGQGPTITVNFNDFSPVALVMYTPSGVKPAGGGGSPKTGEVNYFLFAALAAILVGGVVAGVAVRKNRA